MDFMAQQAMRHFGNSLMGAVIEKSPTAVGKCINRIPSSERVARLNETDPVCGVTPLMAAVLRCDKHAFRIAKLLMEHKASIDKCDSGPGAYPLFMAAQEDKIEMLKMLLDQKACMTRRVGGSTTPLYVATQNGHPETVAMLCNYGAACGVLEEMIDCPNKAGKTPLHMAVEMASSECAGVLIRAGADVRRASPVFYSQRNPAQRACSLSAVETLLQVCVQMSICLSTHRFAVCEISAVSRTDSFLS